MMKDFKWKWQDTLIVVVGLISLGYALMNYGRLPDQLPAHFSITGKVNEFWDKSYIIALTSFMGIFFPLLMQFTRRIDPKKENYSKFVNAYKMIRLAIALLFDAMLVLSVSYGLDQNFEVGKLSLVAVGLLFIVLGNYLPQVKDNYLIGIRTPWTLANPEVWRKTHRFSGAMWMISGLLIALGALFSGALTIILIITGLVLAIVVPYLYSWFVSQGMKA